MALEANTPKLTLEHMSLGSQERLEAGIRAGIARPMTADYQSYTLLLFAGRRPTPDEIKNGIYFLQGTVGTGQLCGIYRIGVADYIELSSAGSFALDGRDANSLEVMARAQRPANPADFIDTDGRTVLHHKFKRYRSHSVVGGTSGQAMEDELKQFGNGAAPTWGLMFPWGYAANWTSFLDVGAGGMTPKTFTRRDGNAIQLRPFAVKPHADYYFTVGDFIDEPTANLVLYKGAERGQTSKPRSIQIQRFKYVMPKTKTAQIALAGG